MRQDVMVRQLGMAFAPTGVRRARANAPRHIQLIHFREVDILSNALTNAIECRELAAQ